MMRRPVKLLLEGLALNAIALIVGAAGLPRRSPPLTITDPSGGEITLSSFRGKVVAIEFFFVRSPRCLQLAQTLNKLNSDLGPQGFQPIAVAFGPDAAPGVLARMTDYFKLTYPVGSAASDRVDAYLGREGKERLKIPQMVIVDRHGMIRAVSGSQGDARIETESSLRDLIRALLLEKAASRGDTPYPAARGDSPQQPPESMVAADSRPLAPDFVLKDTRGTAVRLADYKGQVVLLNFWATWCQPCRAEIPWFNDFEDRYKSRGFAVLGVSTDDGGWNVVRPYLKQERVKYRVLLGDETMMRPYREIHSLPETLLLDRQGRIAARHVGATVRSQYELEIESLLRVEDAE
ncbi:MAG TPA: redoxin domain-containing protein [Bryobacteraceae bacterium]|jgi:cytochrome c biogenesis protein CcmG/thiol:disulfide interchange protein DsbE